jgi:hypothetical protein
MKTLLGGVPDKIGNYRDTPTIPRKTPLTMRLARRPEVSNEVWLCRRYSLRVLTYTTNNFSQPDVTIYSRRLTPTRPPQIGTQDAKFTISNSRSRQVCIITDLLDYVHYLKEETNQIYSKAPLTDIKKGVLYKRRNLCFQTF